MRKRRVGRRGVEQCRETHGLIDLNDSHPYVRETFTHWIKWVENDFDFDGWRADSAKHMPVSFWKALKAASECYTVGEVYSGDSCFVGTYQKGGAMDGLLSYPSTTR
ncbi:Alpha amylase catalytic domain containing protein [Klebsormidium nitens]|uniref:Alpha amylase catalytic domain containing protein n=1 Tax=Klebsormidium nitens TaxID=105231 RepID=A0A1Y1HPE4_KLENI|nr:Alpha amylase catalytic domain containing protein [Klebsormidium nitens]|eukprot:GAQ80505.1 Alpha amylase catalytic domain containing protein [Klebsormidium nitens]